MTLDISMDSSSAIPNLNYPNSDIFYLPSTNYRETATTTTTTTTCACGALLLDHFTSRREGSTALG